MSIHQEIGFKCSAQRVFEALISSEQFAELTDAPAEITAKRGGKFSCFDGMITGLTIEVVPNKRLVQAWRVGNWDEGIYSIVRFELAELSETEARLIFDHAGFPVQHKAHLEPGWYNKYWEPMKRYLDA